MTPPVPDRNAIAECVACGRDVTDHQPGLGLCRFVAEADTPRGRLRQAAAFFADPLAGEADRERFKARLLRAVDEIAPVPDRDGAEVRVEWGVRYRAYSSGEEDRFVSARDEAEATKIVRHLRSIFDCSLAVARSRTVWHCETAWAEHETPGTWR